MEHRTEDAAAIRRYLLEQCTPEEEARIESDYGDDAGTFERLRAAEEALIEDYWRRRLSTADEERFEQHYLASPIRRERAALVGALIERATQEPPRLVVRSWTSVAAARWARVAAAAVVVAGTSLIAFQVWKPEPPTLGPSPKPTPSASPGATPAEGAPWQELSPGLRRSSASHVVALPTGTGPLRLRLELGGHRTGSRELRLQTAEGREVWRSRNVEPESAASRAALLVEIPRAALHAGDYVLSLRTERPESDAEYFFRIPRAP